MMNPPRTPVNQLPGRDCASPLDSVYNLNVPRARRPVRHGVPDLPFARKLRMKQPANQVIVGIWQQFPLPMVSRSLGRLGWDWVILDMQHGAPNSETAYECLHTLHSAGTKPLARTSIAAPAEVQRALDLGALGVVVPMVNSAAEARELAQAAKYPPLGARSFGSDLAWHYGDDYYERANDETLLLVQVEHIDSVNQVEAIMGTPGVDGCFIGPTDLALSMGLSRHDYEAHPEHRAAIARTLAACRGHGKLACANTYSLADFEAKVAQGFDCLTFRSEADLFMSSGAALLAQLRERSAARIDK
jgi:4-hydroxy-2-oxoheptanedioate aldolase